MSVHAGAGRPLRLQVVLSVFFFIFGCGGAAWMVRIPELRQALDVSVSVLGIALFVGAVGSLSALLASGRVVEALGARRSTLIGFGFLIVGQILIAISLLSESLFLFAVGSFVAGIGWGLADVGINVEGSHLEKRTGKTKLPMLHGMYSAGTLSGAIIGVVLISAHIALVAQCLAFITIITITAACLLWMLPARTGVRQQIELQVSVADPQVKERVPLSRRVLMLGGGILCISLAEGGAQDWLTLALVKDYSLSESVAAAIFAAFTIGMLVTRFSGDYFIERLGRSLVVRLCVALGIVGIILIVLQWGPLCATIGSFLWGIGVALGFPVFISAAGDGKTSTRDISRVTAAGYAAFLVGPPVMGFIAEATSLLTMFLVIAALLSCTLYFARATTPPTHI